MLQPNGLQPKELCTWGASVEKLLAAAKGCQHVLTPFPGPDPPEPHPISFAPVSPSAKAQLSQCLGQSHSTWTPESPTIRLSRFPAPDLHPLGRPPPPLSTPRSPRPSCHPDLTVLPFTATALGSETCKQRRRAGHRLTAAAAAARQLVKLRLHASLPRPARAAVASRCPGPATV